jgi:hypothetical protein
VSSCSAAVSTPIGMNFGSNCLISDIGGLFHLGLGRFSVFVAF